ncbi:MAG TPA: ATP-binding cassette domain-containing protein [Haliangiales bacterium]|nr:ATP-binding cassette domain-containing protein [Haliangiales bacterium]
MSDALPVVEVEGLVRRFGELTAVDGVSFEVRRGEIFGFLGPNGAGKSTTIKILATLLEPTAGRAAIAGHDVVREPLRVREAIGIIFQDNSLDDRLTADQNLYIHSLLYDLPRDVYRARADALLEMVDLTERRKGLVRTYSGGMRRRLEIARGLLHRPEVLFLDEPTVGLDPQTRSAMWQHVLRVRDEGNVTVFMTTHYLDEAEHCDRIAIIDHGRVVALGSPEELKRQVGGDVMVVGASAAEDVARDIGERYCVDVTRADDGLRFQVDDGATFIPRLTADFQGRISSVSVHRPTLDDVFLKLTGRAIREEEATSKDQLRMVARAFGRGRRR